MKKKLKLPFVQLQKEFGEIISKEELESIVGWLYDAWETEQGFMNNMYYTLSNGMFDNMTGSGLLGYYDVNDDNSSGEYYHWRCKGRKSKCKALYRTYRFRKLHEFSAESLQPKFNLNIGGLDGTFQYNPTDKRFQIGGSIPLPMIQNFLKNLFKK